MYRQLILGLLLMVSFTGCAINSKAARSENGTPPQHNALVLKCTIMASDFSELKDTNLTKEAAISGMKHQPSGAVKIATVEPYEFWVMAHGLKLNKPSQIINYQVAIKDRRTNQFMHAMSNTSLDSANPLKSARISLVDYYPNSLLEKGELIFECQ